MCDVDAYEVELASEELRPSTEIDSFPNSGHSSAHGACSAKERWCYLLSRKISNREKLDSELFFFSTGFFSFVFLFVSLWLPGLSRGSKRERERERGREGERGRGRGRGRGGGGGRGREGREEGREGGREREGAGGSGRKPEGAGGGRESWREGRGGGGRREKTLRNQGKETRENMKKETQEKDSDRGSGSGRKENLKQRSRESRQRRYRREEKIFDLTTLTGHVLFPPTQTLPHVRRIPSARVLIPTGSRASCALVVATRDRRVALEISWRPRKV